MELTFLTKSKTTEEDLESQWDLYFGFNFDGHVCGFSLLGLLWKRGCGMILWIRGGKGLGELVGVVDGDGVFVFRKISVRRVDGREAVSFLQVRSFLCISEGIEILREEHGGCD